MTRKIFETDGIRGIANIYPMTSEVALSVGRAIAYQARKRSKRPKIIVGKDTRLSCYFLETAIVSGICSMGADALILGCVPTPALAHLTVDMRCDAGIMITASHNSYEDNGIKIFGPKGFKLSDSDEEEIEEYIVKHYTTEQLISPDDDSYPKSELIGKAFKIEDSRGRYIAHIKSVFPKNIRLDGMRVAVDCANGASFKIAPTVLHELGADVFVINDKPNGININEMCGATNPNSLCIEVMSNNCDVGIAVDGDGDRLILVDENGAVVNGDAVIAHLASEYYDCPNVVGTTMSNMGLKTYLEARGGSLIVAEVGDRYVIEKMRREGISIGGETSGHIIMSDYSTTGDGILAGLKVLQYLVETNRVASNLEREAPMNEQILINVPVEKKIPIDDIEGLREIMDKVYWEMKGEGRVLVRNSGTENKLRIMVEHKEWSVADKMVSRIVKVVKNG